MVGRNVWYDHPQDTSLLEEATSVSVSIATMIAQDVIARPDRDYRHVDFEQHLRSSSILVTRVVISSN